MQHTTIFLIGFMGSGKSFMGRRLAETLHYDFIDTDDFIAKEQGCSISDIFQSQGAEAFRKMESAAIRQLGQRTNTVIATGGGMPCFHDNMKQLNQNGWTVYLKSNVGLLVSRLDDDRDHRPLLASLAPGSLPTFIEKKLAEREKYYQQAQAIFYLVEDEAKNLTDFLAFFKNFSKK